jgi:hypothetical protein
MDVIPTVKTARFDLLEAGELFFNTDNNSLVLALKTLPLESGDPSMMVLLRPTFDGEIKEAFLLQWVPATILSLGKQFSIELPVDVNAWSTQGPNREPVCLAVSEKETYICANAAPSPRSYLGCFVNVRTGAIMFHRTPRFALYSKTE